MRSFEVFVNQRNPATDGWSDLLTTAEAQAKIQQLIAGIKIPEHILMQFRDMHICFPGVVCSVENASSTRRLDGFFEGEQNGVWKIKVTWTGDQNQQRVTLEEMSEDLPGTLAKFSAIIQIAVKGVQS